jgi:hypothetical protein
MNLLVEDWGGKSNLMISLQSGTGKKRIRKSFIRSGSLDLKPQ